MSSHRKAKRGKKTRPRAAAAKSRFPLRSLVRDNWRILKFVVVTLASLIGFFVLIKNPYIKAHYVSKYSELVAAGSRLALRLLGFDTGGTGTLVTSPEFSVNILEVCNGLEVTAIFFAAVLGFPATWKSKLKGLLLGYPAIYVVNQVRIVVLFFLGYKGSSLFETVHYYYAQAFVILATVVTWFVWMSLYSDYGSKSKQAVPH